MPRNNVFYAQSGGVTSVINASAAGVIETARANSDRIGRVYAGRDGIVGALTEDLIDTSAESDAAIAALYHTPGGAFGSARYKLKSLDENRAEYERLIEVFKAHDIGYFFYNGGGDSADTCEKVSHIADVMGYPIQTIHIPKTMDNDLPATDCSPGFASVAKYTAVSIREASLDLESMYPTSTKVFILEVMGRHTGWTAAAGGVASDIESADPHIILFPEVVFDRERFLRKVDSCVQNHGYCTIVASEGLRRPDGQFVSDAGTQDVFGHTQLGGVASALADMVGNELGYKNHYAIADYLMRSARHIASETDVEHAYAVGQAAVEYALDGHSGVMVTIERESDDPYRWRLGSAPLADVANGEQAMPDTFISDDGFHITDAARAYLTPLITGESHPPYVDGLPQYARLTKQPVPRQLNTDFKV
ncbi:6-phosphofructokinase [Salinisphaera sp. USBA-960]|nr:6-phosphofructokinase [Salifodinibacter halophilus]NNC26793.1 6-phosphofructokinase [Salifodinibacter halophilus]